MVVGGEGYFNGQGQEPALLGWEAWKMRNFQPYPELREEHIGSGSSRVFLFHKMRQRAGRCKVDDTQEA